MSREASLFQALTAADRLSDLLPVLHHHAVSAVDGRSSILFQYARSGDTLQATSAFGVDHLPPHPWPARMVPAALFRDGKPQFVADVSRVIRGAPEYLGTLPAVLVPLAQMQNPAGVLVIGCEKLPSTAQMNQAASVGHAFTLALDRAHAAGEADLQSELRELLQAFSRDVSSTTLSAGLEMLCSGANRLFDADRTSVWLHDRRAGMIVLSASSDVVYLAQERRLRTSDSHPPAAALRRDRAEIVATGTAHGNPPTAMVTIPLRGRRRALGTLVMEEVRVDPAAQMDLLERADEMGRQLSAAIENVLLLDAVLRSRRELENTFNSLADLVAVCDQHARLVYMNVAFLARIGTAREALIDSPIEKVVGPATSALIHARDRWIRRRAVSAEVEDPKLRGTFVITLTPLVGEEREPNGVVLVARDVTPQAELEAERVELRNRLVQSEKLAALGQFVAGIAHELNNPCRGSSATSSCCARQARFRRGCAATSSGSIARPIGPRKLCATSWSSRAPAAWSGGGRASTPPCRACCRCARRHSEPRTSKLSGATPMRCPRVKADPLLLHQALLNIVLNAEHAIGAGGGRIETSTSVRREGGAAQVVVQIRDTGHGIPAPAMPRLFEPFFTTKEVGKGTGLGLAITYGIIQEHGGHIAAANHPEGGAVFTVQLPAETG